VASSRYGSKRVLTNDVPSNLGRDHKEVSCVFNFWVNVVIVEIAHAIDLNFHYAHSRTRQNS
jgi:hypothetical protein